MFYYFGVGNVIRHKLFGNPWFCSVRGTCRDTDKTGYYGASEARRINALLRDKGADVQLTSSQNSIYELGFDFGQIFSFKVHSSGVLGIRWVVFGSCN